MWKCSGVPRLLDWPEIHCSCIGALINSLKTVLCLKQEGWNWHPLDSWAFHLLLCHVFCIIYIPSASVLFLLQATFYPIALNRISQFFVRVKFITYPSHIYLLCCCSLSFMGISFYIIFKLLEISKMNTCVYLASKPCGTILCNGMSRFYVKDFKLKTKYALCVCHGSAYPMSFHAWQQKTFTSCRTIPTFLEIFLMVAHVISCMGSVYAYSIQWGNCYISWNFL